MFLLDDQPSYIGWIAINLFFELRSWKHLIIFYNYWSILFWRVKIGAFLHNSTFIQDLFLQIAGMNDFWLQ